MKTIKTIYGINYTEFDDDNNIVHDYVETGMYSTKKAAERYISNIKDIKKGKYLTLSNGKRIAMCYADGKNRVHLTIRRQLLFL